jgi:hypothetical protein
VLQKRRQTPPTSIRMYRIEPHCAEAADYLVAKAVSPLQGHSHADWTQLDKSCCFLLHVPSRLLVWQGSDCRQVDVDAGMKAARQFVLYEGAPEPMLVKEGEHGSRCLGCACHCWRGFCWCTACCACCPACDAVHPHQVTLRPPQPHINTSCKAVNLSCTHV